MASTVLGRGVIKVVSEFDKASATKTQKTAGSILVSGLKTAGKIGGAALAATAATAITGGFKRLSSLQNANLAFEAMGLSAAQVADVMSRVDGAVTGTAFSLADGATAAKGFVAAGLEGKQLQQVLSDVADVAAFTGSTYTEVGSIFNKVLNNQKLSMLEVRMLADRGVPIYKLLGDTLNMTGEEIRSAMRKGQISAEDFLKTMANAPNVAQMANKTVSGSAANMGSAFSRLGAKIIEPAFQRAPGVFLAITDAVNSLTAQIDPLYATISGLVSTVVSAVSNLSNFKAELIAVGAVGGVIFLPLIAGATAALAKLIAFQAWYRTALLIEAATKAWAVAQRILNATLLANPIGIAFAALAALGAGFVIAYKNSEKFRAVVDKTFKVVKKVVGGAVGFIVNVFQGIWTVVSAVWSGITTGVSFAVGVIKSAFGGIVSAVIGPFQLIGSIIKAQVTAWWFIFRVFLAIASEVFYALMPPVKAVFSWIATRVRAAIAVVSVIFQGLKAVLVAVWGAIRPPVISVIAFLVSRFQEVVGKVRGIFEKVKVVILTIFNGIRTGVRAAVNGIVGAITGIVGKILSVGGKFFDAGKTLAGKVWDGLKSGFSAVKGLATDIANSIRNGINNMIGLPKTIGKGPFKVTIPAFAGGTNFAPGGIALVGERGPELVNLPRGSRVYPANQTRGLMQSAPAPTPVGNTVIVQNFYGPQTSGERKREVNWASRYATRASKGFGPQSADFFAPGVA